METRILIGVAAAALAAGPVAAQQPQPLTPLAVGVEAPDFTLSSAGQGGVGKPVSLRDLRGQTVVIAFFYRARSSG